MTPNSNEIFTQYIIPAIISAIVGIITAVITAVITYKTTQQMIKAENKRIQLNLEKSSQENLRQRSAEYITNERIRWIQELRNSFAEFRAHTTEVAFKSCRAGKTVPDYSFEINREAVYIKLLLKGYGDREIRIKNYIDGVISVLGEVKNEESLKPYFAIMDALTKEIQICLKVQWERVKIEINNMEWNATIEKEQTNHIEALYDGNYK